MKKQNNRYKEDKLLILKISKPIVTKNGWSEEVLSKLIQKGVNKSDLVFHFDNDYKKLLEFSLDQINILLEHNIKRTNIINFPIHKRIKKILMSRIKILNEDKIFYKKTFYHLILPQNLKIMKRSLYKSVDIMWYLAGDNSTDFNYYTKRLTLAGIYSNALYVLFNKNFDEVESNIDKNLKKISKIPVFKERFSFIKDNLPIFLKGFFN